MIRLESRVGPPIGAVAAMGLVVLQTDETIEHEFRQMISGDGLATYVTRIASGDEVTPETLAMMEQQLPRAVGLLPKSLTFDVIGYCCTSGATVIGPERVEQLVRATADVRAVTNPLSAVIAGLRSLGVKRLGFVTPYIADVSATMRAALERAGFEIAGFGSFMEVEDARVARIDRQSVIEAAIEVADQAPCDAVFLACTNLRTCALIEEIEAKIGKPVLSSNQALAWHMASLTSCGHTVHIPGRLGKTGLEVPK